MAIITLTTDFGTKDHSVGAVKGHILSEMPAVTIVDISHNISPFNILEAAYILKNAYHHFPAGTIHIIGVDSEPSPENKSLIVALNGHYFIGGDNGIISLIAENNSPDNIAEFNVPNLVRNSFPVLNNFCVVACHLARGGKLEVVGKPITKLKDVKDFEPRITNNGNSISGNIIYIDAYGNVVTNISKTLFEAYRNGREFEIIARREKLKKIYNSYNEFIDFDLSANQRKGDGDFIALFNTTGMIELAIYKSNLQGAGSAATLIGLKYQDLITINFL